jgi:hypothetical protein
MKRAPMTLKSLLSLLRGADFGWMNRDERALFLALNSIEPDACYFGKKFAWSVSHRNTHVVLMAYRRRDSLGKRYLPSSLCKTWWKVMLLKFLYLEWMV